MEKLKTFALTFKRSLTEPKYYNDILKAPFSFSLKYLFFLLFLVILVKGVAFSASIVSLFPKVPGFVATAKQTVREFYPPELTITVNDGTVRTNVDEPYTIPFPKRLNIRDLDFAVIDTNAPIDDAKKYRSVLFVNKNAVAYPDNENKGGYKVYFLNEHKGYFIINKTAYDRTTAKLLPYFDFAPYALYVLIAVSLIIAPVFGSLFTLSGTMFYLAFMSLFLWIVSKIMQRRVGYTDVIRLGMHAITFSLVFDLLKSLFNLDIPFTYTAPFIIWMLLVFNSLDKKHDPVAAPVQSA